MVLDKRKSSLEPEHVEDTIFSTVETNQPAIQKALCYLFAPDSFPPVLSQAHLSDIVAHFEPRYLTQEHAEESLFRKAGIILAAIKAEKGPGWNFYLDQAAWRKPKLKPQTPEPEPEADPEMAPDEFMLPPFSPDLPTTINVSTSWLSKTWRLLSEKKQLIFAGPPGTGKTYIAKQIARDLTVTDDQVRLIQFHPSYGYEDFFEGYRPAASKEEGKVALSLKKGPLRQIVDAADEDPVNPYFLVIDEINRGNLARIFGELYFLLEYRTEAVELMYSGTSLSIPPNLFIIGTMNTADRSIALMDSAIRRRFAFVELHPDSEPTSTLLRNWCAANSVDFPLTQLWKKLNTTIIDQGGSRDFLVGPSYFMNSDRLDQQGLELTWETEILPLLQEMFPDRREWVRSTFSLPVVLKAVPVDQSNDPAED